MKNLMAIILLAVITCSGCKKGDDPTPQDPGARLSNTIWAGEYKQAGFNNAKPFSLEFGNKPTVTLYDYYGEHTGTWSIEQGKLEVDFPDISGGFSAVADNDGRLSQLKGRVASKWSVTTLDRNEDVNQNIDNTTWRGIDSRGLQTFMKFKPGTKAVYAEYEYPYIRKAGSIRYVHRIYDLITDTYTDMPIFCVLLPGNVMSGVYGADIIFSLTKQ